MDVKSGFASSCRSPQPHRLTGGSERADSEKPRSREVDVGGGFVDEILGFPPMMYRVDGSTEVDIRPARVAVTAAPGGTTPALLPPSLDRRTRLAQVVHQLRKILQNNDAGRGAAAHHREGLPVGGDVEVRVRRGARYLVDGEQRAD